VPRKGPTSPYSHLRMPLPHFSGAEKAPQHAQHAAFQRIAREFRYRIPRFQRLPDQRKWLPDPNSLKTRCETEPHIPVLSRPQLGIKVADNLKAVAPHEDRCSGHHVTPQKFKKCRLPGTAALGLLRSAVCSLHEGITVAESYVGRATNSVELPLELPRQPKVVGVQERDPLAGGGRDAGVPCRCRPVVLLPDDVHVGTSQVCQNAIRTIRGTIIDHKNLQVRPSLGAHATDRVRQRMCGIVRRNNDAYLRCS